MLILYETCPNSILQLLPQVICEGDIPSEDEVIVEGSVGALWGQTVTVGKSRSATGWVVIVVTMGEACQAM